MIEAETANHLGVRDSLASGKLRQAPLHRSPLSLGQLQSGCQLVFKDLESVLGGLLVESINQRDQAFLGGHEFSIPLIESNLPHRLVMRNPFASDGIIDPSEQGGKVFLRNRRWPSRERVAKALNLRVNGATLVRPDSETASGRSCPQYTPHPPTSISIPTGQWSEPITSEAMYARFTSGISSSLTNT